MTAPNEQPDAPTPYDRLGGDAAVRRLVDRFYALMDTLPEAWEIRRLHPQDLSGSADKLYKFLSGWLGGPPLYWDEYGHPMLRRRHLPFPIAEAERDQWLLCMNQALDEQVTDEALRDALKDAFFKTADHMRNRG
jgi:hemoglobin